MAAGETAERAEMIMRQKLKFAFGRILPTDELLDQRIVKNSTVEIRNGVTIKRISTNVSNTYVYINALRSNSGEPLFSLEFLD